MAILENSIFCTLGFFLSHVTNELRAVKAARQYLYDIDCFITDIDEEDLKDQRKLYQIIRELNEKIEKYNRHGVYFPFRTNSIKRLTVKRIDKEWKYTEELLSDWIFEYYGKDNRVRLIWEIKIKYLGTHKNLYAEKAFICCEAKKGKDAKLILSNLNKMRGIEDVG